LDAFGLAESTGFTDFLALLIVGSLSLLNTDELVGLALSEFLVGRFLEFADWLFS
jgi:hypothetical protein